MVINGRTDLACESHQLWRMGVTEEPLTRELNGMTTRDEKLNGLDVTYVKIHNDDTAVILNKAKGKYYTLSLNTHFERGSGDFPAAAASVAELIRRCAGTAQYGSVLIAALGNPDISPDALGSLAASSILVTRHLKDSSPEQFEGFGSVSLFRTGVLGTTGLESATQIRALCDIIKPELVIAVDALAGAEAERLCRSIQICDCGIAPGSGVGNSRERLDRDFLGVPVIAIGSPTVIDAAALSSDASLTGMFVTPRNIDSSVRALARLIGYGINLAIHKGLTVADIDMLTG